MLLVVPYSVLCLLSLSWYSFLLCGILGVFPWVTALTAGLHVIYLGEGSVSPTLRIQSSGKNSTKQKNPWPCLPTLYPSEISLAPGHSPRSWVLNIFVTVGEESGIFFLEAFVGFWLARWRLTVSGSAGNGERRPLDWIMGLHRAVGSLSSPGAGRSSTNQSLRLPSPEEGSQDRRKPTCAWSAGPEQKQPLK